MKREKNKILRKNLTLGFIYYCFYNLILINIDINIYGKNKLFLIILFLNFI